MIGVCKYCGQTMMTDIDDKEKADLEATRNCKCPEGMEFRNAEEMKESARFNAEELFKDYSIKIIEVMYAGIEALAAGIIKSMSIRIDERTTASLVRTKEDGIQIKRKYKEEFSLEANKY